MFPTRGGFTVDVSRERHPRDDCRRISACESLGVVGIQSIVDDTGGCDPYLARREARFEPGSNAKVAFVLHEGTKVWIERVDDSWTLIELPSGMRGWIPSRVIEVI